MMFSANLLCFLLFSYLVSAKNGDCPPSFECGDLGTGTGSGMIQFPFTNTKFPDCGLLVIHGCDDPEPDSIKTIKNGGRWYTVDNQTGFNTINVRDQELNEYLLSKRCLAFSRNSAFITASSLFSFEINSMLTLFKCSQPHNFSTPRNFSRDSVCDPDFDIYYANSHATDEDLRSSYDYFRACSFVQLPMQFEGQRPDPNITNVFQFLSAEFPVHVKLSNECSICHYQNGGQCRTDDTRKFYCAKESGGKKVLPLTTAAGTLGMLMVLAFFLRRHFRSKENPAHKIIEAFLKQHGHLAARRFSYSDVKKATNSFKNKLGQGGYGSVYKGRLNDGSLVAVKILTELKGEGEEFINEVASISMTSHVNIVSLLGFCLEGSKRALMYEYMPNGSLEKFIYEEKDPLKLSLQLNCKTMYNIAIGVARGLEYLHKGCNTRILHFDIKPHNILLDENFCPKISDFGLAKVCPRRESIISLFGTRGTAGYIAPEVFSRNFGAVSHKSDVYSYGMMVLEMIGGRENINVKDDRSSELYFPHWVYNCIELNHELDLRSIKNQSDKEIVRKMTIVSLWCIQTDPLNRPAMSKVVDMLEGSLKSLQIPPKPFLSSPSRLATHHQTQTFDSSSTWDC